MFDNFYQVSHRLASCKKMKKAHIIIISDTYSFNSQGKVNYKSQSRMAVECGVSIRTINSAIKDLRDLGILNVIESKFKETLKMTINKPKLMAYISQNESQFIKSEFNSSAEDDSLQLSSNGWNDSDTQEFHNDTQNLRNPYAEIADNKNIDKNSIKTSITNNSFTSESDKVFKDSLGKDFSLVKKAMETLEYLKEAYGYENIYTGSQTMEQWSLCEEALEDMIQSDSALFADVEGIEAIQTYLANLYVRRELYKRPKKIGLPFLLGVNSDNSELMNILIDPNYGGMLDD